MDTILRDNLYRDVPLDKTKTETRLLTVHPGAQRDVVVCDLESHSLLLPDMPTFKAVSHAWHELHSRPDQGVSLEPCQLRINGQFFRVSYSLETALRKFRRQFCNAMAVCLWVDAICINQESIEEKNHQVPLMAEIFSKADQVLIWLGDAEDDVDMLLEWIKTLSLEDRSEEVTLSTLLEDFGNFLSTTVCRFEFPANVGEDLEVFFSKSIT